MQLAQIFGTITPPEGVRAYDSEGKLEAFPLFLNNIIKFAIVLAGIYALINLVLAGYAFMSAGDDPKKVAAASSKIWQTLLGLAIAAGSFILAGIFGKLVFNDWNALLQFKVFGPGQ
ncbi:MAG TPA: hypothetical protein VJ399_01380 [Patescibacteria group bacterium]|nr:hypothetical protein [Patescibacteria group bacterium]